MSYEDYLDGFIKISQIFGFLRVIFTSLFLSIALIRIGYTDYAVLIIYVLVFEFAHLAAKEIKERKDATTDTGN